MRLRRLLVRLRHDTDQLFGRVIVTYLAGLASAGLTRALAGVTDKTLKEPIAQRVVPLPGKVGCSRLTTRRTKLLAITGALDRPFEGAAA
jgi:hypothetical protein